MQVFIKCCNTYTFDVEPDDKISVLKQKIIKKLDLVNSDFYLVFGGKYLYDNMTFQDYNMPKDSTIYSPRCIDFWGKKNMKKMKEVSIKDLKLEISI